jgi:hypothetical protein
LPSKRTSDRMPALWAGGCALLLSLLLAGLVSNLQTTNRRAEVIHLRMDDFLSKRWGPPQSEEILKGLPATSNSSARRAYPAIARSGRDECHAIRRSMYTAAGV